MIRVATCGYIQSDAGTIADALRAHMLDHPNCAYELNEFEAPFELIESATATLNQVPYDLVISAIDLLGITGVDVVSELSDLYSFADDSRFILCDDNPEHELVARQNGADDFLLEPVTQSEFDRVVGRQLAEIAKRNRESTIMRCRDRTRRIFFNQLLYVETSGHDQVLHHVSNDSTCSLRASSRGVFAMLEDDGRFFKVGSSYIVNLDYVESFDSKQGFVTLVNGEQIPVPVRLRKAFEQVLSDRHAL